MIGVYQKGELDCVRACVASLFELQLEDVPELDPLEWWVELRKWLNERGMTYTNMKMPSDLDESHLPQGFTLGSTHAVTSNCDIKQHCVVCYDGLIVWCPIKGDQRYTDVPERPIEYTIIYSIDPLRVWPR